MLGGPLLGKKAAIGERWLASLLEAYGDDSATFFKQRKNRFANPVGQTYAESSRIILDEILGDMDTSLICTHLDEIIKIRAVQELTPAKALSFVFSLKDAIRDEIGGDVQVAEAAGDLRKIDVRIDQMALFAFDIFVMRREQVYSLRLNEIRKGYVKPA